MHSLYCFSIYFNLLMRSLSGLNKVPGYGWCKQRVCDGFVSFSCCRHGRWWSSSIIITKPIAGQFINVKVEGWGSWGTQKKGKLTINHSWRKSFLNHGRWESHPGRDNSRSLCCLPHFTPCRLSTSIWIICYKIWSGGIKHVICIRYT